MIFELSVTAVISAVFSIVFHILQIGIRKKTGWKLLIVSLAIKFFVITLLAFLLVASDNVLTWRFPLLLGGLYVAVSADLIKDIVFLVFVLLKKKKRFLRLSIMFSVIFTGVVFAYSYFNMQIITPENIHFSSEKLKTEHRFVFLSDLHYGTAQQKGSFERALQEIESIKPDFIILGGDITDEFTTKDEMNEMYDRLGEANIPMYFIYGNHDRQDNAEYAYGRLYTDEELVTAMERNHVTIVKDAYVRLYDDLILLGREDPCRNGERVPFGKLPPRPGDGYLLCVEHTPYQNEDIISQKADLQLSGHTHDGQLFPLHWVYTLSGLKVHGLYNAGDTNVYVSSGIAGWGAPIRTESHCVYEIVTISPL